MRIRVAIGYVTCAGARSDVELADETECRVPVRAVHHRIDRPVRHPTCGNAYATYHVGVARNERCCLFNYSHDVDVDVDRGRAGGSVIQRSAGAHAHS